MNTTSIRWPAAVGGALIAMIVLIAASIAWVAVYSYLISPGQPMAVYEQHAQVSGPWVSILVGMPLLFALGRWLARNVPTALALWAIEISVDVLILVLYGTAGLPWLLVAVSYLTKLAACYLGAGGRLRPLGVQPAG